MIPQQLYSSEEIRFFQSERYKDIESFVSYLTNVNREPMKTIGLCNIVAKEFEGFIAYQKQLGTIPKEEFIKTYVTFNPLQELVIKFDYEDGSVVLLTLLK